MLAAIPEYTDGVYTANVPVMPADYKTFYVKGGWSVQYIIFFAAMLLLLITLISDKKSKLLKNIL